MPSLAVISIVGNLLILAGNIGFLVVTERRMRRIEQRKHEEAAEPERPPYNYDY